MITQEMKNQRCIETLSSKTYFHVTEKANWTKIKHEGLKPSIGERSKQIGEQVPAIYLFTSEHDADSALGQWLGEEYEDIAEERGIDPEELEVVMLKVVIPNDLSCRHPSDASEYEAVCYDNIPPKYISFHKEC